MTKKLAYEAPQARDLSAPNVSGQQPLYPCLNGLIAQGEPGDLCVGGGQADNACSAGLFVTGTGPQPCTGGSDPNGLECITGGFPSGSQCLSGLGFFL